MIMSNSLTGPEAQSSFDPNFSGVDQDGNKYVVSSPPDSPIRAIGSEVELTLIQPDKRSFLSRLLTTPDHTSRKSINAVFDIELSGGEKEVIVYPDETQRNRWLINMHGRVIAGGDNVPESPLRPLTPDETTEIFQPIKPPNKLQQMIGRLLNNG